MRTPLDYPFASVGAIYVATLLVLALCPGWPDDDPDRNYLAARELVSNHRIASGDLRRPAALASLLGFYMPSKASIEGKYVVASPSIKAGDAVNKTLLADRPQMQLPASMAAVPFPLPADSRLIGMLDAGSPVVVLGQDTESKASIAIPAVVHAIVCEPTKSEGERCYPMLRVAADRVNTIARQQTQLKLSPAAKP